MSIPQFLLKSLLGAASGAIGGNSKAMSALNDAISMSNQYKPNMDGAVQIAQRFGFSAQQMANLRAAALNNSTLTKGLESIAPGATDSLINMSKELEAKLNSTQPIAPKAPTPQQDDVSQRLSRIRF